MDIIIVTTIISSLFLVIGAAEPFASRVRLPYSVILAVVGMLIGIGATILPQNRPDGRFESRCGSDPEFADQVECLSIRLSADATFSSDTGDESSADAG